MFLPLRRSATVFQVSNSEITVLKSVILLSGRDIICQSWSFLKSSKHKMGISSSECFDTIFSNTVSLPYIPKSSREF